jgi:hypothetical protein
VKLWRGSKDLEFELEVPDGLDLHRDVAGTDLIVAAGPLDDAASTVITIAAVRDGPPVSRDEHVARVRANLERELDPHLVDAAAMPLAGHEAWWTIDAFARAGRSLVLDSWMLVRDGVGWTVTAQMPWLHLHQVRDGAIAIVSTLRFK